MGMMCKASLQQLLQAELTPRQQPKGLLPREAIV